MSIRYISKGNAQISKRHISKFNSQMLFNYSWIGTKIYFNHSKMIVESIKIISLTGRQLIFLNILYLKVKKGPNPKIIA